MSTTMTWEDVCAYWDGECNKLMNLNEQVNDFLFDLFRKMLLHQGFSNEGIPFYLGYVSAKYKTKISGKYLFNIRFQPSWKSLDENARICYIGREVNSYFLITQKQNYIPRH